MLGFYMHLPYMNLFSDTTGNQPLMGLFYWKSQSVMHTCGHLILGTVLSLFIVDAVKFGKFASGSTDRIHCKCYLFICSTSRCITITVICLYSQHLVCIPGCT